MSNTAVVTDDAFEAYAKQAEKEAKERASRGGGTGAPREYEALEWTGLVTDRMKVIRAVGGPPDSDIDEFSARSCRIAWIVGDGKKKFRAVLPERSENPDHIIWRIISRIKQIEWVDRQKTYPVQMKHPELFELVEKNGLKPDDKQHMFDRGWEGRQVLVMNVIDREQMDWHRENKHTMLLSRNIGQSAEGKLFPEEGVPSYGFANQLGNLFKFYKSWEKYDIGITRTGLKENPYRIINASKYTEEVPEDLLPLVSTEPLTEEEAGWERYDLSKLFKYTSSTKFHNRMKGKIAQIDAILGTKFLADLEHEVAKEKAEWEKNPPAESVEEKQEQEAPKEEARTRKVSQPSGSKKFDTSLLKGWDSLTQEEKDGIVDVIVKDGKVSQVVYADPSWTLVACPECGSASPEHYTTCPVCGLSFE